MKFKKQTKFILPLFLILPLLILGYQNCAQDASISPISAQNASDEENSNFPPIIIDSLSALGFSEAEDCDLPESDEFMIYSDKYHLCYDGLKACAESFLVSLDFASDENEICFDGIDYDDFDNSLLQNKEAIDLGYQKTGDRVCTQQVQQMVNLKSGTCSLGTDGCVITYLEEQGFEDDILGLCP